MRTLSLGLSLVLLMSTPAFSDWNPLNPSNSPQGRYGHSIVSSKGNIYLYGGADGQQEFNDLYQYTGDWQQIQAPNPPPARYDHAAWTVGDTMYIMGGQGGEQVFNDLWSYDTTNSVWRQIDAGAEKPGPRYGHAAVVIPGGGVLLSGGTDAEGQKLRDLWLLGTDLTYTELANNVYHTSHHSVHFQGEYMYLFGVPGLMSKYNITTTQWGHFNAGPPGQGYYVSALLENEYGGARAPVANDGGGSTVFFFGGLTGEGAESDIVYELDLGSLVLTERNERMPLPMSHGAAAVMPPGPRPGFRMIFFGGLSGGIPLDETFEFRDAPPMRKRRPVRH